MSRVKRWPGWALLAVVVVALLAVGVGRDGGPSTPQERADSIAKQLACPICDGESVFESRNNASESIRTAIGNRVAAGQLGDDEIIAYIESRFGADVLLVPRSSGLDAVVWVLPAAVLVIALAALAYAFWRWRRTPADRPSDEDRELVAAAIDESRTDVEP